jgi:hypothetical protein
MASWRDCRKEQAARAIQGVNCARAVIRIVAGERRLTIMRGNSRMRAKETRGKISDAAMIPAFPIEQA